MSQGASRLVPSTTREAILGTAEALLEQGRLRDLTVTAVMQRLPVSREAFYKHFASRYEVVAAMLGAFTEEVAAGFDEWLHGDDPVTGVHAMFEASSTTYVRRRHVLRAVVEAAPMDPQLERLWRGFLDAFVQPAAARIRADQQRGLASTDIDPRLAAAAMVHLVERLITQELAGSAPPPRLAVVDLLTRTMVGTVYPALLPALAADTSADDRSTG